MIRTKRAVFAFALATLIAVGVGAAGKEARKDGKELYKEHCKSCHGASAPAGEYTPMSLIQDQWQEFFDQKLIPTHENVTDPAHEGKKVLDLLTPEELQTLKSWTIDHAADSENPMTCG